MKIHPIATCALWTLLALAQGAAAQTGPPDFSLAPEFEEGPYAGGDCAACNDCGCHDCCCSPGVFTAGFGFVFLQPHFESDVAFFSTTEGATSFVSSATNFNYDLELTPRVWLEYDRASGLGYRAAYWQFRHAAPTRGGTQVENEDGDVFLIHSTPEFGDFLPGGGFLLETQDLGDTLGVRNSLNLWTVDLEGTKWVKFDCWALLASAGIRYGSVRQRYEALLQDASEDVLGTIDSWHRFDGIGPTLGLEARRPVGDFTLFGSGRASLLYGNGKLRFAGFDTIDESETDISLQRNDVVTVGELQVGMEYCRSWCGWQWYVRTALEGQVWQGAGNPSGEEGDLGLFGFSVALGINL